MKFGAVATVARSLPRAIKATGLVAGVLFGSSGGLAVAALLKAGDVESAYDRVVAATDGFDLAVVSDTAAPDVLRRQLQQVPGVETAVPLLGFEVAAFNADGIALGPDPEDPCFTGAGDVAAMADSSGWRGRAPLMVLSEGRFPQTGSGEVVLPAVTADRLDLAVGDRVVLAGDCRGEGTTFAEPIGVRVSGVGTGVLDGPSVGANFGLENLLIGQDVAAELADRGAVPSAFVLGWLDEGVHASDLRPLPGDAVLVLDMEAVRTAVRADLRPDSTALRVASLMTAVSALVILGPTLGRLVRSGNADVPVWRGLGMDRRQLMAVTLVRGMVIAAVVAAVAAPAIAGFSTRLPLGSAALFEGSISFGPGVSRTIVGAVAVGAVAFAVIAAVSWITLRQVPAAALLRSPGLTNRITSLLGLGPAWSSGVRFALEPGSRRDPTPVRSGLTTAAVAVAAVLGVITFSMGLDQLRNTPRLYGLNWDAFVLVDDADTVAAALDADPDVERLARGTFFPPQGATLGPDRTEVWLMSFEAGPGRAEPTVIEGRAPRADQEILLAHELSATTGASIGELIDLHLPTAESMLARRLDQAWDGRTDRVTELEVVGIGVLPVGDGRVGIGASMTLAGLQAAVGPTTTPALLDIVATTPGDVLEDVLREALGADVTSAEIATMSDARVLQLLVEPVEAQIVVFDADGPDNAARIAIAASGGELTAEDFAEPPTPEGVINLDLSEAGRIPDAFSGLMAAVALLVTTTLIATGGRHRRHDLALLRALGFGPRQVRRALRAQAVTTVAAASVLTPVGIALGRLAWRNYATSLGVVPQPWVSPAGIALALGALLAACLAVATITALLETRHPPTDLLKAPE